MKRTLLFTTFVTTALLTGITLTSIASASNDHSIPYPENYETHMDEYGADAFANSLDHEDSMYFTSNDYYNMTSSGSLHLLEKFETYQQTTEYSCGAASSLMVLNYFGESAYDEIALAEQMNTDTTHGTTVEAIRDFFQGLGWNVDANASVDTRFSSPEEFADYLVETIDAGTPVMVDWVDWCGHWQVVIGIDTMNQDSVYDDVLILADPYDVTDHAQDGYYVFPLGRFFGMWYEGPCTLNEPVYQQPFVVAAP